MYTAANGSSNAKKNTSTAQTTNLRPEDETFEKRKGGGIARPKCRFGTTNEGSGRMVGRAQEGENRKQSAVSPDSASGQPVEDPL